MEIGDIICFTCEECTGAMEPHKLIHIELDSLELDGFKYIGRWRCENCTNEFESSFHSSVSL